MSNKNHNIIWGNIKAIKVIFQNLREEKSFYMLSLSISFDLLTNSLLPTDNFKQRFKFSKVKYIRV